MSNRPCPRRAISAVLFAVALSANAADIPLVPGALPPLFGAGLVPEYRESGIVFPAEAREDPASGSVVWFNALGNPFWFVPGDRAPVRAPWRVSPALAAAATRSIGRQTFRHAAADARLPAALSGGASPPGEPADAGCRNPGIPVSRNLGFSGSATNLILSAFSHTGTSVLLRADWPAADNPLPENALDLYLKTNLLDEAWTLLRPLPVPSSSTNLSAEIPGADIPGFFRPGHVHDASCPVTTNLYPDPLTGLVETGLVYRCPRLSSVPPGAFFRLGTRHDSDFDGLPDAYERLASLTDPLLWDTDDDGLGDGEELSLGTDPISSDSDGDLLSDRWEIEHGLDPADPADASSDADGDGLTLREECLLFGTDPLCWDTDADGLPDGEETALRTNPLRWDTDGDGLSDGEEIRNGTNPKSPDSDDDGLGDKWETEHAPFDPLDPTDASADFDGDGVSNLDELDLGLGDWRKPDTDADGLSDGEEANLGTDPLSLDADGDGLSDAEEIIAGTDPFLQDTDGDGCPDGWEALHGFDPLSGLSPVPSADSDGDGLDNAAEARLGTDPFASDTDGDGLSDREEAGWISWGGAAPFDLESATNHVETFSFQGALHVETPLPFPVFVQNAWLCSNIVIHARGHVNLATTNGVFGTTAPSRRAPLVVQALDDELTTSASLGSTLRTAEIIDGGTRHFVIEYRSFGFFGLAPDPTNAVSFQIDFRENAPNEVRVCYFRADGGTNALSPRALGNRATLRAATPRTDLPFSRRAPVATPGLGLVYHFGTGTDPLSDDSDGDGILDSDEITDGTDPRNADTDGDRLDDGEEEDAGTDPKAPNAGDDAVGADPDGDGLSNGREVTLGTDRLRSDTDGDGVPDGVEWGQGSDPLDPTDFTPRDTVEVTVRFGDESESYSEKYEATVTPVSGDTRPPFRLRNRKFGEPDEFSVHLVSNAVYGVSLRHLATNREEPDLDYSLEISVYDPLSNLAPLVIDPEELTGTHSNVSPSQFGKTARVAIVRARILADKNRDGIIDESDNTPDPLRMWINDDCDEGDVSTAVDNIPGQEGGRSGNNSADGMVNGVGDLLDFFPVWLDFEAALDCLDEMVPNARKEIVLFQNDAALNGILTILRRQEAGLYRTSKTHGDYSMLEVHRIGSQGGVLDEEFLEITANDRDCGVILVEGTATTNEPLLAELRVEGKCVLTVKLPLSVSGVEDMFFFHNLRPNASIPDRSNDPPNNPTNSCIKTHVFLAHGFQVTEEESRAWGSEFFKRFWQEGSRAPFHMISWLGNGETAMSYESNVKNAFNTAIDYAGLVNGICGFNSNNAVVLAHSLGNMLTSAAICDGNLQSRAFFALNGAVPAEAYTRNEPEIWNVPLSPLVHADWRGYAPKTWANHWHELFPEGDDRAALTWRGRFTSAAPIIYNYFSSGDEVLELKPDSSEISLLSGIEWDWELFWIPAIPKVRRYVWQKQALFKGRNPVYGTQWAGWGFHVILDHNNEPLRFYAASDANSATTNQLRSVPVFRHYPETMFSSVISQDLQNEILARGIPESTPTIGIERAKTVEFKEQTDMESLKPEHGLWPERDIDFSDGGTKPSRWLHSDLMSLSHFFTYRLFRELVEKGTLK